jgi:hypothetical protein
MQLIVSANAPYSCRMLGTVFRTLLTCSRANPPATFPIRLCRWLRLPPLSSFSRRRRCHWCSHRCRELMKFILLRASQHADFGCKRGPRNCIPWRTRRCDGAKCAWHSSTARKPGFPHCVLCPPRAHTNGDDWARSMRVRTVQKVATLTQSCQAHIRRRATRTVPGYHAGAERLRQHPICRAL